jgi:hypothetical protein
VTPDSGTVTAETWTTFTFQVSDGDGYANLDHYGVLLEASISGVNACLFWAYPNSNILGLRNDADTGWAGSYTFGSANFAENSQCRIDYQNSTLTNNGNNSTASVKVWLKPGFTTGGWTKHSYLCAVDVSGISDGWDDYGSWYLNILPIVTLPDLPGVLVANIWYDLEFTIEDGNGVADIGSTWFVLHATQPALGSTANSCFVGLVFAPVPYMDLQNDAGSWTAQHYWGTGGVFGNSQCEVDADGSSYSSDSYSRTVTIRIRFKPAYIGTKYNWILETSTHWKQSSSISFVAGGPKLIIVM